MLLLPRLYLVVALALRCFFPIVVVVVDDVAAAAVGIRFGGLSAASSIPRKLIAKHSCQLQVHRRSGPVAPRPNSRIGSSTRLTASVPLPFIRLLVFRRTSYPDIPTRNHTCEIFIGAPDAY